MTTVTGTCSLDCPDACSWVVTLEDGVPVKLRGNPNHPFTAGGLCGKVNPYLDYAARPDRLLHPLRRAGAKGGAQFTRISWDEALGEIASRIEDARDRHGTESIWPFGGTGTVGWLQGVGAGQRLFHSLGASRSEVTICSPAGHVGMSYTMGTAAGMNPEDLSHSGVVVLWGTNTLTSNQHLWPFVRTAQRGGSPVVVIDPIRTRTAERADRHLAPMPGTDGALTLGLMAELVDLGAHDEAYLSSMTKGWETFRDEVLARWSVERAASVCSIAADDVRWLAETIADRSPLGIRSLMGMQRHGAGGAASRLLSCIPALTGAFQHRGGGICYSTSPAYPLNVDALCRPDLQPAPTRSLATTRLGEGLLDLDDPPVQVLVMWAANPVVANPDTGRVREGLAREDLFTVVVDHVETPTTAFADIVLPGTTQLEHPELQDSYSHLYLNWNEPATEPPGDTRSHTEIFRNLAAAMGLTEPALFDSDHDLARAALNSSHPALEGITLERLRAHGWLRLNLPDPWLPFAEGFPTPSGRFEFASERAVAAGHSRLPDYIPPYEAADPGAGMALVSPANHHILNSTFAGSPLHARAGSSTVTVHPDDADRLGLVDGGRASVGNDRGAFRATVRVSDATRRGVAMTTKGTSEVNNTVAERDADMGRGAVYHDNVVAIEIVAAE